MRQCRVRGFQSASASGRAPGPGPRVLCGICRAQIWLGFELEPGCNLAAPLCAHFGHTLRMRDLRILRPANDLGELHGETWLSKPVIMHAGLHQGLGVGP